MRVFENKRWKYAKQNGPAKCLTDKKVVKIYDTNVERLRDRGRPRKRCVYLIITM